MPKELTEADMADHRVTYAIPDVAPKSIRAAYVTTEDKHPDMLAFKDWEHRTVALVNRGTVLEVERMEPGAPVPAEQEARMAEMKSQIMRGFQPTSQLATRGLAGREITEAGQ